MASDAPGKRSHFGWGYVTLYLFKEKGGGELRRDFSMELAEPRGEDWEDEDLPVLLPKLWAKYHGIHGAAGM